MKSRVPTEQVIEYSHFSCNQRETHLLATRVRLFQLELRYKVNSIVREQRNLHTAFEVALIRSRSVGIICVHASVYGYD